MIQKIKKILSSEKIKFSRGYSYISTIGIPFLVARSLGEMFPNWGWFWFFIPVLFVIWLIGQIDYKKGFYANEADFGFENTPGMQKLYSKIENLEKEVSTLNVK